jgi:hypothetical protein
VTALLPSYSRGLRVTWEPMANGPAFVRSAGGARWHRPRSGIQYGVRTCYHYWCGASANYYPGIGLQVDEIRPDEDLCATCDGRYQAQQDNRLRFDPIAALPPRKCPASHDSCWVPQGDCRRFDCPVCGEPVGARGSWRDMPRVRAHAPGPGLVDPCRFHGWFHLTFGPDRSVVCACTVGGED